MQSSEIETDTITLLYKGYGINPSGYSPFCVKKFNYSKAVIITYADGSKYDGYLNEKNQKEGFGEWVCGNGNIYIAQWKNDKMDGIVILYINSDCYTFLYDNGERQNQNQMNLNIKLIEYMKSRDWKYDHLGLLKNVSEF